MNDIPGRLVKMGHIDSMRRSGWWLMWAVVFCFVLSTGAQAQYHSADTLPDYQISLSELLRVIQFFNSEALHCEAGTEDGYAPGTGSMECSFHTSDYNPQDWAISLSELLRLIQFFNSGGYHVKAGTEDGFGAGLWEGEGEIGVEGQEEGEGSVEEEGEGAEEGAEEGEIVMPTAAFDASPWSGRIPVMVQFMDQSISGSSAITGWLWDFGDGGSSEEQHPAHEYTVAGVYSVTLTVETVAGTDALTQLGFITAYAQDVVINEFLASNDANLQDEDGDYSDWLELYNPNPMAVPLVNWSLTDNAASPDKWIFPAILIPGEGYLVVFASGKDRRPVDGSFLHTNFKMNANDPDTPGFGEYLALFNMETPPRATTEFDPGFPTQTADVSYGWPDAGTEWCFFSEPTPWVANGSDCGLKVGAVQLNYPRGYYGTPISLTMNCPTPDAQIRYTLDGSAPMEETGFLFNGDPLEVAMPIVLRVSAFKEGYNSAPLLTNTYLIGMDESMKALPALSIVGDPEKSLYEPNGIWAIVGGEYVPSAEGGEVWAPVNPGDYNNVMMFGREYERPVSLECLYAYAEDGPGFQVDCGVRVHGGEYVRPRFRRDLDWTNVRGRMGYGIYFRDEYGPGTLNYPLFGNVEVQKFNQLVLRTGHVDAYNPFFKDEYVRRLHGECGSVYAHGGFAHLFVNGVYKGYINPVEHLDGRFFQSWYGEENGWDVMTLDGAEEGTTTDFYYMLYVARELDVSDPMIYEDLCRRLDVTQFIDFLLVELYGANWDFPARNWVAAKERVPEAKFRFYVWDAEATFFPYNLSQNGFIEDRADPPSGGGLNGDPNAVGILYRGLKQNAAFRQLFSDRAYALFLPGGALCQENLLAVFSELYDELSPVIPELDTYIRDVWIPQRQDIFAWNLIQEGLLVVK